MKTSYIELEVFAERWSDRRNAWETVHMWRTRSDGTAYVTHPPYRCDEDSYRETLIAVLSGQHMEWIVAGRDALPVIAGLPDGVSSETKSACAGADHTSWLMCSEVATYPWLKVLSKIVPATPTQVAWYNATGVVPSELDAPTERLTDEILLELTPEDLWGSAWLLHTLEFITYAANEDARVIFSFTQRGSYAH